jgi:hypothetical protein
MMGLFDTLGRTLQSGFSVDQLVLRIGNGLVGIGQGFHFRWGQLFRAVNRHGGFRG